MTTLKDISKKAGVSVATVSKVINNTDSKIPVSKKTKETVLKIAKELNYSPNLFARTLRTKKSGVIGVIVSNILDPFFTGIIEGIEKELNENDYYFILSSVQNDPKKEELYLKRFSSIHADGLLILGGEHYLRDEQLIQLIETKVPVVVIGRKSPHIAIGSITIDNFQGGFIATEYLIKLGHKDILHITSSEFRADGEERIKGYVSALGKYGLGNKSFIEKGGNTPEHGYRVMMRVFDQNRKPTAVFTYNDMAAFGVMRAIKENNLKAPDDIAVVGFDDIPISQNFNPSLTTIRQPQKEMGKEGAEILLSMVNKQIGNEAGDRHIVIEAGLVIRESA